MAWHGTAAEQADLPQLHAPQLKVTWRYCASTEHPAALLLDVPGTDNSLAGSANITPAG
jgi:hypothetical protein